MSHSPEKSGNTFPLGATQSPPPANNSDHGYDKGANDRERDTRREVQSSCLYVGNLSSKVTNTILRSEFERFGDLEYSEVIYEP